MGLSVSLDVATRALRAQQLGVDVVAHNIANANTPGFSRQELLLVPVVRGGVSNFSNEAGLGVDVATVRRIRDQFVDFQLREVMQTLGRFDAEARALEHVEVIFNEPSENGLSSLMADFWNGWRDLSNNPESAAARATVMSQSQLLVSAVRREHDQLRALQRDLDTQVVVGVADVNRLGAQVAVLNKQIIQIGATGANVSDMQDQRDLRLDELSRLVNTTMMAREDGSVTVIVGGRELVSGVRMNKLTTVSEPTNLGYRSVRWEADGSAVDLTSGAMFGQLQARDVGVAKPIADLNTLMAAVITQVNAVHTTAFGLDNTTGEDYFTGTDASDIGLNATLVADVTKIGAASAPNLPGDASKALAMADLQAALTMNGNTATFGDFYNASIGNLGVAVLEARSIASNQEFLRGHLDTMRESVAGVSLDEEMTNLIKFQRAFEAAARLISVVDSMLETLINRVGLGGR